MPPSPTNPTVNVITPEGNAASIPEADLEAALSAGFQLEGEADVQRRLTSQAREEQFGGVGGAIEAGVYGAARGATFGLSDVAMRAAGADPVALRGIQEANPGISTGTEIAGAVLPSLVTAGTGGVAGGGRALAREALTFTPAGAAARGSAAIAGLGEGGSLAARAGYSALGGAAEGAAQTAGSYLSDVALEKRKLSAEAFVASLGTGALLGGALGGALPLAEEGLTRGWTAARDLIPKHEATRDLVEAGQQRFAGQLDSVLRDGDQVAKTARQRVQEIQVKRAELNLERQKLVGQRDAASKLRIAELNLERQRLAGELAGARGELAAERSAARGAAPGPPAAAAPLPSAVEAPIAAFPEPAPAVAAPMSDLEAQLAATQGRIAGGEQLGAISGSPRYVGDLEDTAIAQIDEQLAPLVAEEAKVASALGSLEERRAATQAWIDRFKPGARSQYSATATGGRRGGGAGAVRTDRTRVLPEGGVDFEAHAGDRVFAGIGEARDTAAAGGAIRVGSELDAAYDDVIERASNAATGAEMQALAREAGAIEDEILGRVAARGGRDADDVAKIRAAREQYGWTSVDVAARRAEKLGVAKSSPPRAPGARARLAQAERADLEAFDRGLRDQQFSGGRTAGQAADELLGGAGRRLVAGADAAPQGAGRQLARSAIDEPVGALGGPRAGALDVDAAGLMRRSAAGSNEADIAEAIDVLGGYEAALHDALQAVKLNVPAPAAESAAKEYAAAVAKQGDAITAKGVEAAEEAARSIGKPEVRSALEAVSLPAPPAAPAGAMSTALQAAGGGRKLASRAADIGAALEVLNTVGVPGLPDLDRLPVIGPILGLYLKVRAAATVWRRLSGKVPTTVETKVATRAAEMRTKVVDAVDRVVRGTGRAAQAAKPVMIPAASQALARSLLAPEEERAERPRRGAPAPAQESPLEARLRELSGYATDPDGLRSRVRAAAPVAFGDLGQAIQDVVDRRVSFLMDKAPKDSRPAALVKIPWRPSPSAVEKFGRYLRAVEEPMTVFEDLEHGMVTPEAAEALRVVYPELYAEARGELVRRAGDLVASVPYAKRQNLSILFKVPIDQSQTRDYLAWLGSDAMAQSAPATSLPGPQPAPGTPPQPAIAADVSLSQSVLTAADRRAAAR
jgi:hypothetical protein